MGVEGVIHFKIWEVLFRDMGGAVLRYGRCCIRGWRGGIHPEIWRGCFEILEGLFRDMGVAEIRFGRRVFKICRNGGLLVSV